MPTWAEWTQEEAMRVSHRITGLSVGAGHHREGGGKMFRTLRPVSAN